MNKLLWNSIATSVLMFLRNSNNRSGSASDKYWLADKERLFMSGDEETFENTANLITSLYDLEPYVRGRFLSWETYHSFIPNLVVKVFQFRWSFDSYRDGLEFFNIMKAMPSLKELLDGPRTTYRKLYMFNEHKQHVETKKVYYYRLLQLEYVRESGANEDPEEDFAEVILTFESSGENE